jgi:hypothetical protein
MAEHTTPEHRSLAGRIVRIVYKTVLIIIVVIATIALLILTPPVQNFLRKKATAWLTDKLQTRVEIGKIYLGFPKKVVLEKVYIEDRKKDTLLAGGQLKVDVSMLKLLHSELEINDVQLSDITAKVKRQLPDTAYNFQFIIDAFAPADTTTKQTSDSSSMKISVKDVALDRIRLVYDDTLTGNDVTFWLDHFDTEIDEFDLDKMRFNIPSTNISGIRANVYQRKPLVEPEDVTADTATAAAAPPIDIDFGKLNLKDINIDYGNDVSAFYTKLNLGNLVLNADDLDMNKQIIRLDKIQLDNTTASIRLGKSPSAKTVEAQTKQEAEQANAGWRFLVKNIALNNNHIAFANDNEPRLQQGMDYMHLDAKDVTLHAENFIFSPDSIGGNITRGQLKEQSGFVLNTLQTNFLYSNKQAYLHDLLLETPGTSIKRSLEIRYPSMEALQKDIGKMQLDVDVNRSRVQVKDILTFVPTLASQPMFADPSATMLLHGNITGSVANMNIHTLQLQALSNTQVNVHGRLAGLPDAKKVSGNLVIGKMQTNRRDIEMLAPKGALPSNIELPQTLSLNGNIAGSMQEAKANLKLNTDLGNVAINGTAANVTDSIRARYDATVTATNLQLGTIMKNDTMYGPLTATITAKGTGYAPKYAAANVNANINSAFFNRYNYKDVKLTGDLAEQKANFAFNVNDPNITVSLNGKADISGKFPAVVINATIDSINTLPLHFTADTLMYKGTIAANFPNTDPDNLEGKLLVTKSLLATNGQRYPVDTIALNAGKSDTGKFINFRSDVMTVALTGKYNVTQLGAVIQQSIQPYYALDSAGNKDTLQDYDFNFTAQIIEGPLLKIVMPTITKLEPINTHAHFASNKGFQFNTDAPLVLMGENRLQKLKIDAHTTANAILFRTTLDQFATGASMIIYNTSVNANIADNQINFLVNLQDANDKNKYRFGGLFAQPENGVYTLKMNPDSLLLNYDKWQMTADNLLRLNKGDINVHNFAISRRGQQLKINSTAETANSPLEVALSKFRIGTITGFAKQDTALIDGVIDGKATVQNIAKQPTFTSDLAITNLMFRQDTVGNLNIKVDNPNAQQFNANITLTGRGNDVAITGNYNVKPENKSTYAMVLDMRKLQMASIQAFSMGAITEGAGYLKGRFDVSGTFDKPDINGKVNFQDAEFTPVMLGSHFTIDNENIAVIDNYGIHFEKFSIQDSLKNKLTLDGDALTDNFINYQFKLRVNARNFQALNSTKQNNKLFYGQFYFNTNLNITGTEKAPRVDGRLKVNDKTKLTVVMPQEQPGVEDREGIVRFVDMDSARMDTTVLLAQADSLGKSDITGMDISVIIEIDKAAELTLIVDEANGDFLRMKGTAELTGGIDPSGKTTLAGTYEIEEGAYQISLNLLKRKFDIQKGSKITWLGEPTKANVDLTAIYVAETAPITLVENTEASTAEMTKYKQKLPFQVKLILGGELLKPTINFDIALPENDDLHVDATVIDNVNVHLDQLKTQQSELNKQVFALLLLNRFVQENPFASSDGGGFNAGTVARQSVSKLLSEQLNSLAADLISGVDVNFDLASTEDYTTGSMQNRTDLNVSLSKELLNDRLRVTVGSNFELEGPQQTNQRSNNIAGNVALDYMLSKDGRYLLRAYRKNDYEGELEGYIIETGVNFILSFDYNHFHNLFKKKKKRHRNSEQDEVSR